MGVVRAAPASKRSRLTSALVASLIGHALLLPLLAQSPLFRGGSSPQKRTAVSFVSTPRSQVQRLSSPGSHPTAGSTQGLAPQLPPTPQLVELVPKQPEKIDGQVVSIGQPKDERAPEKPTKYLSEKDSRVQKETRAKETSAFYKNALSKAQKEGAEKAAQKPKTAEAQPLPEAGKRGEQGEKGGKEQAAQERAQEAQVPSHKRIDRLQVAEAETGSVKNRSASDAIPGEGKRLAMARPAQENGPTGPAGMGAGKPGAEGQPGSSSLKPLNLSLNDVGSAIGPVAGGPMNDDLRGLEEGDETLLNSRSFRYAGFLNRVKETVGRIWVTNVQSEAQRRDPTGQLYSYKDRKTVVEFTLDAHGDLRDVHVAASSGVDYLDRVAVDAFKKAERFPNPPVGLMGSDGVVRLPFAFTLLTAQGGLRLSVGPAYLPNSPAQRGF